MGVGRGPVQKTLKTASKYAERGYIFTRIQVKVLIHKSAKSRVD